MIITSRRRSICSDSVSKKLSLQPSLMIFHPPIQPPTPTDSLLPRSSLEGPSSVTNEACHWRHLERFGLALIYHGLRSRLWGALQAGFVQTRSYRTTLLFWKLKSAIYLQARGSVDRCNMRVLINHANNLNPDLWREMHFSEQTNISFSINKHSCVHCVLRSGDEPAHPL